MAVFKNKLTWSFSRSQLFNRCRRAYYYHYYGAWGGWRRDAAPFARKAYILKNVRNMDAWVGDVVHQIIEWILKSKANDKEVDQQQARDKAKQILLRTWEQSRTKTWRINPKNSLNLFEHYYNQQPSKEALVMRLEKVTKSLNNFYNSPFLQQISRWGSKSFLSIEQLDSFSFDGVQIFAIPDFALYNQEYMLYDWKTGKPNDNNRLQLSLYIFYAMAKYKATKGQIKIIPVYLTQDDVSFEPIQPLDIDTVKNYIRDSIKDMKDVLSDVENNTADIENFPLTADLWKCHSCKFKELCDR